MKMLKINALLADGPLPDPKTLHSPSNVPADPLINHGEQLSVYIGSFLLVIGIVAIVGFFSRRFEYALIAALVLSFGFIAFLAFSR
ncbi:hypothetical protein [[Phormidium] sp. LEGE 05292]|uniref:hypothetical protein n=1 Tax=[Phormidium] sp. LEGE 05292 TaxID=767427 RepID=UPI001D148A81|nr:hypothetical protein [Phormidium sp. LEGE 05292]